MINNGHHTRQLMKRIVVLILLMTATLLGYSQDDDNGTIDAQRPTLTESYSILVPGMIQFENGLDYFDKSGTTSYGTFFRGSVTNRVELEYSLITQN